MIGYRCEMAISFSSKIDFNLIADSQIRLVENEINNSPVNKFDDWYAKVVFLLKKGSVAIDAST